MIIGAIDPSFAHFGMAKLNLRREAGNMILDVLDLKLVNTEKMANKIVRQNSDDLRRAKDLIKEFHEYVADCALVFSEVPTGSQSARSAWTLGIALGVVAGCPKPFIQVQPFETKLAAVGTKTASKQEMIDWATEKYPAANWLRSRGRITQANEHLADAVGVAYAGIRTDQFLQLMAMRHAA